MRINLEGARISDMISMSRNRLGVGVVTLTGTFAIGPGSPHVLALDAGGSARNVTLPANPRVGDWFYIINTTGSALVLTIQDSAGGALTPACTPTQNEMAFLIYLGATLGWKNIVGLGA
jgi:hypothetical protein